MAKTTGYSLRSRGAAQNVQCKMVFGPKLRGCKLQTETAKIRIAVNGLNPMTRLGCAAYERVA